MRLPDSVEKGTRITATEYAALRGVSLKVLLRAIGVGLVRAELVQTGARYIRLLDAHEGDEDWAKLPRCPRAGCDQPVVPPSLACSGPHARGLETQGTTLSAETRRRMSIAKEFTPRPDAAERLKREWQERGPMVAALFERDKTYFKGSTRRNWKLKWAPKPGRPRLTADPEFDAKIAEIQKAYVESYDEATGKHASERTLAAKTGTSRYMVGIPLRKPT